MVTLLPVTTGGSSHVISVILSVCFPRHPDGLSDMVRFPSRWNHRSDKKSLFFQKAGYVFIAKAGAFFAKRVLPANRFDLLETSMAICRGLRAFHEYVR
jgi:hypothetical protein